MPQFSDFDGFALDKTLSLEETIRAIRFSICAEIEAVQLYEKLARSSKIKLFKNVMNSIISEEKVHIGELIALLLKLNRDESTFYKRGFREVNDIEQPKKK